MVNISKNIHNPNKISLLSESFEIEETATTSKTGEIDEKPHKVYLVGKALTFGKPTRNKVAYTHESGLASLKSWEGKPFLNSHKDDDVLNTIGHVENMEIRPDDNGKNSLFYKVDIDPTEEKFIRKVKRKDIPYVSVQVLVSDVRQKETMEHGNYIEADIKEGLELSSVLIPGETEAFGYISEEKFAESFLSKKEQYPDAVTDIKKNEKPMTQKGDTIQPNAGIVPIKPTTQEDISTSVGDSLIQEEDEAKKIKQAEEPKNKITPDLIPRRMISMQGLDKTTQDKTNVADETQEDQEAEYKYNKEPAIKYYKKGGNNIPAVPLKGYKAENISTIVSCCNKPMIVMKNSANNLALLCGKCGRNIVKNEKYWKAANTYFKEKLRLKGGFSNGN